MCKRIRQRPPRKMFLWLENETNATPTYLHSEVQLEMEYGSIDKRMITKRHPLYCISVMKVVKEHKVINQFYRGGYSFSNYEKIEQYYTFDTAALYRLAYSQAKHYREKIGGGKIVVEKSSICNMFQDIYGTWTFRVFDKEGNKCYYIKTEPVYRFCIQPTFLKRYEKVITF